MAGTIKSLGVTIDKALTFNTHVDNVCKAVCFHTRSLRHVRRFVDADVANYIASSMVGSRLDYCNSLLYETSASSIARLQRLQNSLARIVTLTPKRHHITPVMAGLHWLPIAARINFKIAALTFKILTTGQPDSLSPLIQRHVTIRSLRSTSRIMLQQRKTRTDIGSRAFSHAAPAVWNSLPQEIVEDLSITLDTFKRRLKAYWFKRSYTTQ